MKTEQPDEMTSLKAENALLREQLSYDQGHNQEAMRLLDAARVDSNGPEGYGKRQSLTLPQRIEKLLKREVVDPWMPIETAPKDGTEILLCRDGYVDYLDMIIGFWRTEGLATPGMYGTHNGGLLRPDVWRYWMPKPLPPKKGNL